MPLPDAPQLNRNSAFRIQKTQYTTSIEEWIPAIRGRSCARAEVRGQKSSAAPDTKEHVAVIGYSGRIECSAADRPISEEIDSALENSEGLAVSKA